MDSSTLESTSNQAEAEVGDDVDGEDLRPPLDHARVQGGSGQVLPLRDSDAANQSPIDNAVGGSVAVSEASGKPSKDRELTSAVANKLTRMPLGRVKHIMKLDPDLKATSNEAAFLVTKALEMFVESLAQEANVHASLAKKRTITEANVRSAISTTECLFFLDGAMEDED